MDKTPVRNYLLNNRAKLSYRQRVRKSLEIMENLIPLLKDSQNIAFYVNRADEVITETYLNYFIDTFNCISASVIKGEQLEFYQIKDTKDLVLGSFGILEPIQKRLVNKTDIDTIIVPMVGFDEKGNRMGYGKGFYDRYLSDFQGLKIGIAFEASKYPHLPTDEYDVPMDYVVSERKTYQNKKY